MYLYRWNNMFVYHWAFNYHLIVRYYLRFYIKSVRNVLRDTIAATAKSRQRVFLATMSPIIASFGWLFYDILRISPFLETDFLPIRILLEIDMRYWHFSPFCNNIGWLNIASADFPSQRDMAACTYIISLYRFVMCLVGDLFPFLLLVSDKWICKHFLCLGLFVWWSHLTKYYITLKFWKYIAWYLICDTIRGTSNNE